ncbi:hypothetical protein DET65_2318 [Sunxiuqinia elliptica]|uniref:Uncharacterized protein n=1 Tax=Sunxiuqinia elliptica TaxID=655355 RepID=A0A4R6GSZ0_9BACT|nr:hypothetical protein DET52_108194 [Sunxiuqinia elliptica]TDO60509.1 hypothetical protein DET65_2318 [Sunxiuqinia elliptica]
MEHQLLAASDKHNEKHIEEIRHQMNSLYTDFIYV